jgi:hypothetical protein
VTGQLSGPPGESGRSEVDVSVLVGTEQEMEESEQAFYERVSAHTVPRSAAMGVLPIAEPNVIFTEEELEKISRWELW